jgi:hypothetical protein
MNRAAISILVLNTAGVDVELARQNFFHNSVLLNLFLSSRASWF